MAYLQAQIFICVDHLVPSHDWVVSVKDTFHWKPAFISLWSPGVLTKGRRFGVLNLVQSEPDLSDILGIQSVCEFLLQLLELRSRSTEVFRLLTAKEGAWDW